MESFASFCEIMTEVTEQECPGCGGNLYPVEVINEKKDACYYKVKSRYKVWPSAYASGALVKCRKAGADSWGTKSESTDESELVDENIHQWFQQKWVRFGPDGKIKGECARGSESEGKPKCLPQAKAHAIGKKARASAATRKRREDPNPERSGSAINVSTGKKKVSESFDDDTLSEKWTAKYKRSIDCSHPKGFSQKAHCQGRKKQHESVEETEMTCPDCDMCETHANMQSIDEACWKGYRKKGTKKMFGKTYPNCVPVKEDILTERGADSKGYYRSTESGAGLTAKGAKHFGIHTAVTKKPSELNPNGKAAKRRKSFCARMKGNPGPMKDEKGRPTRKAMSLRRWHC